MKKWQFCFLLISIVIISSCSVQRRLAKEFVAWENKGAVLLFVPDFIYKTNLKEYDSLKTVGLSEYQVDSLLFVKSDFLREVSDSALLTSFITNYITGMKRLGYNMYTQDYIDLFMADSTARYVINVAQIVLEEYYYDVRDQEYLSGQLYYATHSLNAVNMDIWFEISLVNEINSEKKVFYTSGLVTDNLYSTFNQNLFTGDIDYNYSLDSMKTESLYELASYLGGLYSSYTNDYFMNLYLNSQLIKSEQPAIYFHYDPETNSLGPAYNNRLEEL